MSRRVSSTMQFDARMDLGFSGDILLLLDRVEDDSRQAGHCRLKQAGPANGWVIECVWQDQPAMQAHFVSQPLQDLIRLLSTRAKRIVFSVSECIRSQQ